MIGKQGIMLSRRFASAVEGKELLLRNDAYYNRLNRNDISYRLQKKGGTVEELKLFAASQLKEFTEEEMTFVNETVEWFLLTCKENGYHLPFLDEIVLSEAPCMMSSAQAVIPPVCRSILVMNCF